MISFRDIQTVYLILEYTYQKYYRKSLLKVLKPVRRPILLHNDIYQLVIYLNCLSESMSSIYNCFHYSHAKALRN